MTQFYSRIDATLNGDVYSIPFSYAKKSEINVFINDELYTEWEFLNNSQIKLIEIPSNLPENSIVSIRRTTDISEKVVDYTNQSMLNKENLNLSQNQLLNAVQEVYDDNTQFKIDTDTKAIKTEQLYQTQIDDFKNIVNTQIIEANDKINTNSQNIQKHVDDVNEALHTASDSIDAKLEIAEGYKEAAAQSVVEAQNIYDTIVPTVTEAIETAQIAIGRSNTEGTRGQAITAINQQRQESVSSVSSVGNSAINTISRMQSEINQSKENAKDFYQKAVGWNINYETDGEEDCLVFEDRTDEEINQAKNYIEDTRDKALTSIEEAKTSALNSVESTRASVVSSVTTAGNSAISNINSAKTSATQEISSTKNDVVSSVTTAGTNALNSINSAKTSAINEVNNAKTTTIDNAKNSAISSINTAKTEAVNTINSTKTTAVNACAEQVALAKEYAQMANGWNFSYDEENETLVFVENV